MCLDFDDGEETYTDAQIAAEPNPGIRALMKKNQEADLKSQERILQLRTLRADTLRSLKDYWPSRPGYCGIDEVKVGDAVVGDSFLGHFEYEGVPGLYYDEYWLAKTGHPHDAKVIKVTPTRIQVEFFLAGARNQVTQHHYSKACQRWYKKSEIREVAFFRQE